MTAQTQAEISSQAVEAARLLFRRLGLGQANPVVLHHSQHVSIRLDPFEYVARTKSQSEPAVFERLEREVGVARYLAEQDAPSTRPLPGVLAGPHVEGGFLFSLWEYVDHIKADDENRDHIARGVEALGEFHRSMRGFPGKLPSLWSKLDECSALLNDEDALTELDTPDRASLLSMLRRLRGDISNSDAEFVPIHGDAHLGNLLITADGCRWTDLEDACLGPREWDFSSLPESAVATADPLNPKLMAMMRLLRSLCVAVWCWNQCDLPEKREAAEFHLSLLKASDLAI